VDYGDIANCFVNAVVLRVEKRVMSIGNATEQSKIYQ
jgi:hypothetical protein